MLCVHVLCAVCARCACLPRPTQVATRELVELAGSTPVARLKMRGMGVGSRINIVFLQSLKDAALHEALLELKAMLR